jgi:UDP-GlcNAc:undecaprenyl-phosphate GlcNAc-1-phosphate transferase
VIAFGVQHLDAGWSSASAAAFVLAMAVFAVYLSKVRVYDADQAGFLQRSHITPIVSGFMYKRRVAEVLLDLCLVSLSYYCAYRLRFEGEQYVVNYRYFIQSLPIVIGTQMVALFVVGGYRGVWRQFSLMDAVVFAKGVALASVAAQIVVLYLYRFEHYSRAVFVIHAVLLLLMLASSRASFRLVGEFIERRRTVGRRCVIYGAGDAASVALREVRAAAEPYRVLGLIDDDPTKARVRVAGYSVLGDFETLRLLVSSGAVEVVVISTRNVSLPRQRELERMCVEQRVTLLRLHVDLHELVAS